MKHGHTDYHSAWKKRTISLSILEDKQNGTIVSALELCLEAIQCFCLGTLALIVLLGNLMCSRLTYTFSKPTFLQLSGESPLTETYFLLNIMIAMIAHRMNLFKRGDLYQALIFFKCD